MATYLSIPAAVYQLSALSYLPGVDSVRQRAVAEAELIHRFQALQSERDSLKAERDRLLAQLTREDGR